MAMSGAERQRKWIAKNRAIHNLRRRNARKKDSSLVGQEAATESTVPRTEATYTVVGKAETLAKLRELVETPPETSEDAPTMVEEVRPAHISLRQWNETQRRKKAAKEGGYALDDYVQ